MQHYAQDPRVHIYVLHSVVAIFAVNLTAKDKLVTYHLQASLKKEGGKLCKEASLPDILDIVPHEDQ